MEVRRAVGAVDGLRLLASVHLGPGDPALAAVRLLDGGVEHPHRRVPDVGPGPVALDERHDGMIGHLELAVGDGEGRELISNN